MAYSEIEVKKFISEQVAEIEKEMADKKKNWKVNKTYAKLIPIRIKSEKDGE